MVKDGGRVEDMSKLPSKKLKVFLSYCSEDKPSARGLYQYLSNSGYDVWMDEKSILPGQVWDLEIDKAIRSADAVIVVLSKIMVNKEGFIQKELKRVLDIYDEKPEGEIYIIPVLLDDCKVPTKLGPLQYIFINQPDDLKKIIKSLNYRALSLAKKQVVISPTRSSFYDGIPKASPLSHLKKTVEQEQHPTKSNKGENRQFLNLFGIRFVGALAGVLAAIALRLLSDEYYTVQDDSLLSIIAKFVAKSDIAFVFLVLIAIIGAVLFTHYIDVNLKKEGYVLRSRYFFAFVFGFFGGAVADILAIFVGPLIMAIVVIILALILLGIGLRVDQMGRPSSSSSVGSSPLLPGNPPILDHETSINPVDNRIENPGLSGNQYLDGWSSNNNYGEPYIDLLGSSRSYENIKKELDETNLWSQSSSDAWKSLGKKTDDENKE
jgi:hypothetical protein